jgi:ketosteroid isomerase-like protein
MREDIDTLVSYYADSFVLRRHGEEIRGRAGIRRKWEENFAGWAYERPLLTIERFVGAESLAVAAGVMGGTLREKRPGGATRQFELPYLASWTLGEDGRWLLRDLMVLPPPPPPR